MWFVEGEKNQLNSKYLRVIHTYEIIHTLV